MQKGSLGLRAYEKMTEEEREKTKGAFLQSVNDIVRNIYRKKEAFGYEDGMFRSFFLNSLELPSFENFLMAEGITLSEEEREILEREVRGYRAKKPPRVHAQENRPFGGFSIPMSPSAHGLMKP